MYLKVLGMYCFLWATLLVQLHAECTVSNDEFLTTFHPHLDAFWLNTDDELKDINFRPAGFLYNMNQRNSKTIFNSMLEALTQNSTRRYFVTEVVFFKDWYDYLKPSQQQQVADLLHNGQIQIGNGGWVENDEAVCYYDDILDQYTIGHNWMMEKFSFEVKVGWATDSFGHSHSQAALEHLLGIQFQGIERVDDRYVHQHNGGPLLEFYWQAVSDSNNRTYGGVLNLVRHFLHQVNNLRNVRSSSISSDYRKITSTMNQMYNKNKHFRFLGNDFEEFIPQEFENLEAALKEMNEGKGECPMYKYGNPSEYVSLIAKYYEENKLPTRKFDFMPNWDQDRYWSGYYTSDPQLKVQCKDFSRLVNLYRKMLLKSFPEKPLPSSILTPAEQLLSVLQHHDGITATSKLHIEDLFKKRMEKATTQILSEINQIYHMTTQIVCKMFSTNNICQITEDQARGSPPDTLYIITEGNVKREKVEIILPKNVFYEVLDKQFDIFCENEDLIKCRIVFEAVLFPGVNEFGLKVMKKEEVDDKIFILQTESAFDFAGRDYHISLSLDPEYILYEFNDGQFLKYSFHSSPNQGSSRQTMAWNKYGEKTSKTERVVPGIYIMSNTGKLDKLTHTFTSLKIAEGLLYRKFVIQSSLLKVQLTIKHDEPNIVDFVLNFEPPNRNMADYFLQVESTVKSNTMFHDSNGYLVSKREVDVRPDYKWDAKEGDRINANNYPACSFAYLIKDHKKFLVFLDRAQGVAMYNENLLINIDRLGMDDGKGIGEGYSRVVKNTFHYKMGIMSENDDMERLWQRQYDEANVAYLSSRNDQLPAHKNNYYQSNKQRYLKYSIFYLNDFEIVLRLHNLAEHKEIQVLGYEHTDDGAVWKIEEVGLELKAKDIRQSYANGIVKESHRRRHWGSEAEINTVNSGENDKDAIVILRPLQIRSFRINFKNRIPIIEKDLTMQTMQDVKQIHEFSGRKRCF